MKTDHDSILAYVADMAAVEKHTLEAVERQRSSDTVRSFPDAASLIDRLAVLLQSHVTTLEAHGRDFPGGSLSGAVKATVAGALGAAAGVYDKIRKDEVSRMLRDDYTALSLATISYTMLYSTALGLRRADTAKLALAHLQELTPYVMSLSEIIPGVVLKELSSEGYAVDLATAGQAVEDTQKAWHTTVAA